MTFVEDFNCYVLKLDGETSVLEQFTGLLDDLKQKFEDAERVWLRLYHLPEGTPFEVKASLSLDCMGRRWHFEDYPPLTVTEMIVYRDYLFASDYYHRVKAEFERTFPSEVKPEPVFTPIKKRRLYLNGSDSNCILESGFAVLRVPDEP